MLSFEQIIVYFVFGLVVVRYLVGALYDMQVSFVQLKFLRRVKANLSKRVPKLTVVLFGISEPSRVSDRLLYIINIAKRLKNVDVLLIDNASKNGSLATARMIAKDHPAQLRVVTVRRRLKNRSEVLKRAKKTAKGSLVLVLPIHATIKPHSIIRLQQLFSAETKVNIFNLQELLIAPRTNAGVYKIFARLSNRRYSQALNNSKPSCFIIRKRCITTEGELKNIKKPLVSQKKYPVYYTLTEADRISNNNEMSQVYFRSLPGKRTFSARVYGLWASGSFVAESFVYAYALFLAIFQGVYEPLLIGYALVTGCYAYTLVFQNGYSFFNKLEFTVYLPVLFLQEVIFGVFIRPAKAFVQIIGLIKRKELAL